MIPVTAPVTAPVTPEVTERGTEAQNTEAQNPQHKGLL